MDGLSWLIKNGLEAAGVKIDPVEITRTIETAKILIPKIAADFSRMEETQKRIESKLDTLLSELNVPLSESTINALKQQTALMNGVAKDVA